MRAWGVIETAYDIRGWDLHLAIVGEHLTSVSLLH